VKLAEATVKETGRLRQFASQRTAEFPWAEIARVITIVCEHEGALLEESHDYFANGSLTRAGTTRQHFFRQAYGGSG